MTLLISVSSYACDFKPVINESKYFLHFNKIVKNNTGYFLFHHRRSLKRGSYEFGYYFSHDGVNWVDHEFPPYTEYKLQTDRFYLNEVTNGFNYDIINLLTLKSNDKFSGLISLTNNKKDVYKTYEKIANWMDKHRSRVLFEKPYLDRAISYLTPDATVLDLGCGTGEPIGQYFVDAGFQVTGVDASTKMLEIAISRCSKIRFILSDMRTLNLDEKFDCIIAWHSFFHLLQDDQRAMFKTFISHLKTGGILIFTSGPEAGEVWSDNGGENLYHASLSTEEYRKLLRLNGFEVIEQKISDSDCGDATIWLARLM